MNIDKLFDPLVSVVFDMSTQLVVLGTKDKYIVISFHLGKGETIPQLLIRDLQARSSFFLFNDGTRQIKILKVNTSWKSKNLNT